MENKQVIERFWGYERSGEMTPPKSIAPCPKCGGLPAYYASAGGFNFYGYYKCNACNLFATGRHQFPAQIMDLVGENDTQPKLFVVYNGETNPEDGWNELATLSRREAAPTN